LGVLLSRLAPKTPAKNQALNENIGKVMIILAQNLGHPSFCVEVRSIHLMQFQLFQFQ
jgi:hypothetical protein